MAGRTHVDDSVIERRLRPIYDWLDNGNNKKAAQEAEKVLRKQPNLQCAKVLKALAFLRLGKKDACVSVINDVVSEGTSDDATLQALTICYREMHQPEKICSVYETAARLDPSNEEIISHLFMAHVRVGDFRKQQQTAMQLYRLKPKNPYYFWAVMSIVMQARTNSDKIARKISLELAERMVAKFVNEDKIDSEAEVMMYLFVLEVQEKYSEALEVLEGPLAKKIIQQSQNFIPLKKATYHTHLKQHESSSVIYMKLIIHEPDNWQHYTNYTTAIMSDYEDNTYRVDPLIEASRFLKETREKALHDTEKYRSPHLGLLQLALALKENGLDMKIEELCGDVVDQLYLYIKNYGDKACSYGDIVNFIVLIPRDERDAFLMKMEALVELNEHGLPVDIKNIFRHQMCLQLHKALGLQDSFSAQEHLVFADKLVALYHGTTNFSADMPSTDIRPNDTYLILATHSYFACLHNYLQNVSANCSEDSKVDMTNVARIYLKMCCIMEHGIDVSKANFQMKLLLIKAYNLIGATGSSFAVYQNLDLKHIQLDTLGHVLTFQALDTARHQLATSIFSNTLRFFMANYKDTSDPLIMSYKFGSFVRIPEFVEFRNRLNNSLHFATVTTEQMLLELTTEANCPAKLHKVITNLDVDPAKDKTDWDSIEDNRDIYVMNMWEPERRKLLQQIKCETFSDDTCLLKIRSHMLRIVAAAFQLRSNHLQNNCTVHEEKSIVNGESNENCDNFYVLNDLITSLETESEICDKYTKHKPPEIPLQGPDTPRIYSYCKGKYIACFLKHARLLHTVYNCTEGSKGLEAWSEVVTERILEATDSWISDHISDLESFQTNPLNSVQIFNREYLVRLWHFVQTLALIVILLECSRALLAPLKASISKKNKKKKEHSKMPSLIVHFNEYIAALSAKLRGFDLKLQEKSETCRCAMEKEVANKYSSIALDDTIIPLLDHSRICESIEESLCSSLNTLSEICKSKLTFLTGLRL